MALVMLSEFYAAARTLLLLLFDSQDSLAVSLPQIYLVSPRLLFGYNEHAHHQPQTSQHISTRDAFKTRAQGAG